MAMIAEDLLTAPALRVGVRVCYDLLSKRATSARWLVIRISKKHWNIEMADDSMAGCDEALKQLAHSVFVRISEYLDTNAWESPQDVIEWMKTWLHGTFYVGNIGRWNGRTEEKIED